MNPLRLSASMVLYRSDLRIVSRALSALQIAGHFAKKKIPHDLSVTIVDNSDDTVFFNRLTGWLNELRVQMPDWQVNLIRAPGNLGYGRGNNLVIETIESDYHLVINPDVFVEEGSLFEAVRYLHENPDVGLITPAIFDGDGRRQYLCKRNPYLLIMFLRCFSSQWLQKIFKSFMNEFEMLDCDYDREIHQVEYPTGSCMFFRTTALKMVSGFDPKIFLHYEDADIGRRLLSITRTVYVPKVAVTHLWARETHKSLLIKWFTIKSGYYYWRKWGGVFGSTSTQEVPLSLKSGPQTVSLCLPEGHGRRVLVTGANGFVGSALCKYLAGQGYTVLAVVRTVDAISQENRTNCKYIQLGNLDANTDWSVHLQGVDAIVHLVARVHVIENTSSDQLTDYRKEHVDLTLNLARQAANANVRRFVFLSSIKVNGEATPFGQPFLADDIPVPKDPYGAVKLECENALLEISKISALEVSIIRSPLVYGKGVKANFKKMMYSLVRGVPLPLAAVTQNRRSFIALDNLMDLIVTCLHHSAAANQIFLASDGEDLSTAQLLKRMGAAMGLPARLIYAPPALLKLVSTVLNKQDIYQRLCGSLQLDIKKTRHLLGWTPPVSVDEGLRRAAEDFRT